MSELEKIKDELLKEMSEQELEELERNLKELVNILLHEAMEDWKTKKRAERE
ncbi:unknown [Proteobacteria bacterium CAG:495]|jgi:hypothetical protein|nr:unknown [Proteobacteria bacterium CAG:495]